MSKLPPNPSLTHLKNQAKALRKGLKAGEPQAFKRLREALPHFRDRPDDALGALTLVDAQLIIAREYGFAGWVALRDAIRTSDPDPGDREAHLLEAVIQNDAETVKALLAQDPALVNIQGPFPNYSSGGEFQLLYIAAVKGNAEIVGILLDHGADIHTTQEENWTALTQAILRRHHGTIDLLIERGARVGIDAAVMMDDMERVNALLDGDPDLVNHIGAGNSLPINLVKSVEMARLLLDHGADLGTVGLSGFADHPELAAFFIENGATIDIESAIRLDDIERAQTLLAVEPDLDMRDSLVSVKSAEIVRLLLDHGADPNTRVAYCNGGYTVLQIKLWQRDLGLIEMLLNRGADPRGQDSLRGWTATEWAERWHRWEEARALLAKYEEAN